MRKDLSACNLDKEANIGSWPTYLPVQLHKTTDLPRSCLNTSIWLFINHSIVFICRTIFLPNTKKLGCGIKILLPISLVDSLP